MRNSTSITGPSTEAPGDSQQRTLSVFWIERIGNRPFFFGEPPPESTPPPNGFVRWLGGIQERLTRAEGGMGQLARKVEDWLKRRVRADEALLGRLRDVSAIDLGHSSRQNPKAVLKAWRRYLHRRRRRHWPWFLVYLVLAPFTLLLAILPGPNVIGFWFAYRALAHGLTAWGAHRGLHTPTNAKVVSLLDSPLDPENEAEVRQLAADLRCPTLPEFLERIQPARDSSGGVRPSSTEDSLA